jgi:hypothetical protein
MITTHGAATWIAACEVEAGLAAVEHDMPLRIMAWNIHEGLELQKVTAEIRSVAPEIVLLNEVFKRRWPWQANQIVWLSEQTGLPRLRYR